MPFGKNKKDAQRKKALAVSLCCASPYLCDFFVCNFIGRKYYDIFLTICQGVYEKKRQKFFDAFLELVRIRTIGAVFFRLTATAASAFRSMAGAPIRTTDAFLSAFFSFDDVSHSTADDQKNGGDGNDFAYHTENSFLSK